MKKKNSPFSKNILESENTLRFNSVLDIFNNIVTFGGIISSGFVALWNFVFKPENGHWLPFFVLIILTALSWVLLRLIKRNTPRIVAWLFTLFSKPAPYTLLRRELTYEYVSTNEMRYTAFYTIKALQTGVDHIQVRFNWSGSTETNPLKPLPIKNEGCVTRKIVPDGNEFGYSFYKLYARTSINRGDEPIKLGVKIESMKDENHKASPHFLTNINVQTEELKMVVILCSGITPENIEFLEYLHAADDNHWRRYTNASPNTPVKIVQEENGTTKIIWEKKKPILGGKYIIKWNPQ